MKSAHCADDALYFYAWAGNEKINQYIKSQGDIFFKKTGIKIIHVKVSDYQQIIKTIQAEKKANNFKNGSADILWINGENFAVLKKENLLTGPIWNFLPNAKYLDENDKNYKYDFNIPTEGYEAPWGRAQFVFIWDKKKTPKAPDSASELLDYAKKNTGKIAYVKPPQFHGTTFLKQILIELNQDNEILKKDCSKIDMKKTSAPLWTFLDQLHPYLWRKGKTFPLSVQGMHQMFQDNEILNSMSFNPQEADSLILKNEIPPTSYSASFKKGGIGNVHFLSIPFNTKNKEKALLWINHLLSIEAQLEKSDIKIWGDPTVLDLNKLPLEQRNKFPVRVLLGQLLPEPNACWVQYLNDEWIKRYGVSLN